MKKSVIFLIIAVLITGAVSAQAIQEQGANPPPRSSRTREVNPVTVEGTLKLEKGSVAVENAGKVYVVPMLNRYIGFINGLREGAKVSVEGYEFRNVIRPTKVTIEGKSYDFMSRNNSQVPEAGKRDSRRNDDRFAPVPYENNRRNDRRNSRGGCCS